MTTVRRTTYFFSIPIIIAADHAFNLNIFGEREQFAGCDVISHHWNADEIMMH